MPITVTLDADAEQPVRQRVRERGTSFKQALNDAIRAGLAAQRPARLFRTPTADLGLPHVNLDRALQLNSRTRSCCESSRVGKRTSSMPVCCCIQSTKRTPTTSARGTGSAKRCRANKTVGLPWVAPLAFLRLSTKVGVFPRPLPDDDALAAVRAWIEQPPAIVLQETPKHLEFSAQLLHHHAGEHDRGHQHGFRWDRPARSGPRRVCDHRWRQPHRGGRRLFRHHQRDERRSGRQQRESYQSRS